MTGPDDGTGLYPDGQEPCLVCGGYVNVDFTGDICWHFSALRKPWEPATWCPGSRTSWEVPDAA